MSRVMEGTSLTGSHLHQWDCKIGIADVMCNGCRHQILINVYLRHLSNLPKLL